MVAVAMIQLAPSALRSKLAMLAAAAAFILIAVLKVNTAYVILLFALIGMAATLAGSRRAAVSASEDAGSPGEGGGAE